MAYFVDRSKSGVHQKKQVTDHQIIYFLSNFIYNGVTLTIDRSFSL